MPDCEVKPAEWYIERRPCPGADPRDLLALVTYVQQHLFHQFAQVEAFDMLGQFLDEGGTCAPLELPGDYIAPGTPPLDLGLPDFGRVDGDRGFGCLGDEEGPGPGRERSR